MEIVKKILSKFLKLLVEPILRYMVFVIMFYLGRYLFERKNQITPIGIEKVPRKFKILFIAGAHRCYMDSYPIRYFLMKHWGIWFGQRYMPYDAPDKKNFYSNRTKAYFMKISRNIPIERELKHISYRIIESYINVIQKPGNIIVYPEGGRTKPDNTEMQEFKIGVAKTILLMTLKDSDFTVVPIYVGEVMKEIMPREIEQHYLQIKMGKKGYIIFGNPVNFLDICISEVSEDEKLRQIQERGRQSILVLREQAPPE